MREQHGPRKVYALQEPVEHWPMLQTWVWVKMQGWGMDGDVQKGKEKSKCSESLQKLRPEAQLKQILA